MKLACGVSAFSDDGVRCFSHAKKDNQGPNMIALRAPYRRKEMRDYRKAVGCRSSRRTANKKSKKNKKEFRSSHKGDGNSQL